MVKQRNTIQKDIIFGVVQKMHNHPSADAIYEEVVKVNSRISRATVYRNLNQMDEQGLIYRVQISNGADLYDYQTHKHYHIKCKKCGKVFDVDLPYMEDINQKIVDIHGYKIVEHSIVFKGLCLECNSSLTITKEK